ncbi:hypothetical protein BHM03_00026731 [Ensete ventricosum]|nr:hypothetical protein BHM03_00026731 [Ensete ventricosum]
MPFSVGCVNAELGSVVTALVLDIAKLDGLVDLSLKPELVGSASTKDAKKVLSVPEYSNAIGYASTTDYNTQKLPRKHFVNGQRGSEEVRTLEMV